MVMYYGSRNPYIGKFNARWILSAVLMVIWVVLSANKPNFGFSNVGHIIFLPGLAAFFFYMGWKDKKKGE